MTEPQAPTAFDIFKLLHDDHQKSVDRVLKAFGDGLDHYQKMVTLPLAMAGIVVPLLASQKSFVNIVLMRHATIWLCVAAVVGILSIAIGRWLFAYQLRLQARMFQRQMKTFADAAGDMEKLARADFDIESDVRAKMFRISWLAAFGDAVFYGSILGGIIEIARAVLKG